MNSQQTFKPAKSESSAGELKSEYAAGNHHPLAVPSLGFGRETGGEMVTGLQPILYSSLAYIAMFKSVSCNRKTVQAKGVDTGGIA